jgi:hypothetical protein
VGCGGATGRGVGVAMTDGADVGGGGLEELLCRRAGAICKVEGLVWLRDSEDLVISTQYTTEKDRSEVAEMFRYGLGTVNNAEDNGYRHGFEART